MWQITPEHMHKLAIQAFHSRRDIGLRNAVASALLEPANPFQPSKPRRLSRGIGAALVLAGTALAGFAYFSFLV